MNKLIAMLRRLFNPPPEPINPKRKSIPTYHLDKMYDDMNRKEKREYKKWLIKNELWDAAEIMERKGNKL